MAAIDLDRQLAALGSMSPAQLASEWQRVYRGSAPALTPDLLRRGVAHRLQEKAYGTLSSATARLLARAGAAAKGGTGVSRPSARIKSGTRLSREWHGRMHHVLVLDDGVLYSDQIYPSLTAVAKLITGSNWSGPRFFGLASRRATRVD